MPELNRIAIMNDKFRKLGTEAIMTKGIQALVQEKPHTLIDLLLLINGYTNFTPDNDPYDEHDFGSVEWRGEKVFWKIDYYDKSLEHGEDPLSENCRRVLTVMLANEY